MDFVHDVLLPGEKIRVLTVIDRHTRECLALVPQHRFNGAEAGVVLRAVSKARGGLAPVEMSVCFSQGAPLRVPMCSPERGDVERRSERPVAAPKVRRPSEVHGIAALRLFSPWKH